MKKKDPQKVAAAQARAAALSPERRREISKLGVAARQGNQGEHNGNAKLSEADVRRIKERLASGETNAEIAATYGVTGDLIRKIKRGTLWRNVPGPGASETPE